MIKTKLPALITQSNWQTDLKIVHKHYFRRVKLFEKLLGTMTLENFPNARNVLMSLFPEQNLLEQYVATVRATTDFIIWVQLLLICPQVT